MMLTDLRSDVYRVRKRAVVASLYLRERRIALSGWDRGVENIYFGTIQRSGSQWIRELFDDPRIRRFTGLPSFPQHRYEWDEFVKRYPRYTFVPGLYMSYDLYEEIDKPRHYRTFYVIRDPRSIAVSWYWAALKTHSLMGKIGKYRQDLQRLNFDEGLSYSIRALAGKFTDMRTWMYNAGDPNVLIVKFEDVTAGPMPHFRRIFQHCDVRIPDAELEATLADYTREKMRARSLVGREEKNVDTHYRARSSDYRDVFTPEHHELFRNVTGDLVELLGYEPSRA
jgi:hypothetical protein